MNMLPLIKEEILTIEEKEYVEIFFNIFFWVIFFIWGTPLPLDVLLINL